MTKPKILIVGAGGVGGYYGGRLHQAGGDVTFLVRQNRQETLQKQGLIIKSVYGNITLAVKTITSKELEPLYDYILLTTKAYDLEEAITTITPLMQGKAVLVPFLNGMAHLEQLNRAFGAGNVLGGVVMIHAGLTPQGIIEHSNDSAYMFLGEQDGNLSQRAYILAEQFKGAKGVEVRAVDDILARMWAKWVLLSAMAGMTCLMRANIGEIVSSRQGYEAMEQFIDVNLQLAAAHNYPLAKSAIARIRNILLDKESTATASMLRDLENGGRVEGEHILGDLLCYAQNAQINHPLLALAYAHIKAYEARLKGT